MISESYKDSKLFYANRSEPNFLKEAMRVKTQMIYADKYLASPYSEAEKLPTSFRTSTWQVRTWKLLSSGAQRIRRMKKRYSKKKPIMIDISTIINAEFELENYDNKLILFGG